jgi:DNA-binding transcriptional LysR family regulator
MITYPNLFYLKYFSDAVDLGSVSGAARKNMVTHPAISRAISALETHLGVELLVHKKKIFKVTEEGYRVAKQARVLLTAATEFNSFKLESPDQLSSISIGISRTLTRDYLNAVLKQIKAKFPMAHAHVRFGTTSEIIEAVAKSTLDLGITIGTQNLPTLKQDLVKTGKFVFVESATSQNTRDSFETKSFIVTEPRFETELLKRQYQNKFGKILPVSLEIRSWEVIGQLVQHGLGVGLMPDIVTKNWKRGSFRLLRPTWFDCDYEIYVHYSRTPSRNHILQHSLDFLLAKT